ncbi:MULTISPECIES: hypothetical protein [unclassified Streptomyces]|uniref:hypothetical protein n=1 Tax=unclassified Streptomyces TaxID=2593676 RepID=UPI0033FC000B
METRAPWSTHLSTSRPSPSCTAPAEHRPLPADSHLAQAVTVLARAQQNAISDRRPQP